MLEKDLNGIIRKSFSEQGDFAFKIYDSGSYINGNVTHTQSPYDGFAYYDNHFVAWESKFMSKVMSFSWQRLEDHQLAALKKTKDCLASSYAIFLIGVRWSAKETRVYIFTDLDEIEKRRNEKSNILKKEWLTLNNYVKVSRGQINIKELLEKGYKK